MAGMLPGVESARRRRFHGNGGWSDSSNTSGYGSTRRSFCLYNSNYESPLSSTSSLLQRTMVNNPSYQDEKLGGVAREAKDRLDERLRAQWKLSEPKRTNSTTVEERPTVPGDLHMEVYGLKKKNGLKRLNWGKMRSKASEQDECAVCLDNFKPGETLAHLPCDHRFHSRCLVPWLENNARCPCCRMEILAYKLVQ